MTRCRAPSARAESACAPFGKASQGFAGQQGGYAVYTIRTYGECETIALGAALAAVVREGDVVLLSGPVGAGKSVLARALIQQAQRLAGLDPEDVPSPSFTLTQVYSLGGPDIWHCDLYRLSDSGEILELGLSDVLTTGPESKVIALIEWPDLIRDELGPRYVDIRFVTDADDPEVRVTHVDLQGEGWSSVAKALSSMGAPDAET